MPPFTRRDFLRIGSLLSGTLALRALSQKPAWARASAAAPLPNVLVLLFDALSATNLSLYGYHRKTTPNLERFASRATLYRQHYSAANFTTPGTASLLTGLYPWSHRAINYSGLIAPERIEQNLFHALGDGFHRLAFAENKWPNYFFAQWKRDLEQVLSPSAFCLVDQDLGHRFAFDRLDSRRAFDGFLFQGSEPPASLVFGLAREVQLYEAVAHTARGEYPYGLPRTITDPSFFRLEDLFDGLIETVASLPAPWLAYLHLWTPHSPYAPKRFYNRFADDGWTPNPKPAHPLAGPNPRTQRHLDQQRKKYDAYIANLDAEFGRLLDHLTAQGILEDSYVVVTSDHGEMFERGVEEHATPLLYDPVVRVPLMISSPGQTQPQVVDSPTSSLDVLPTLLHLLGKPVPDWCEGGILPILGGSEDPGRSIFMMEANQSSPFRPLTRASFAMRKGAYKLSYYKGREEYAGEDRFELYDMEADPDELNDLYPKTPSVLKPLKDELVSRVAAEDAKPRE